MEMESSAAPSNSRVYSLARMKRREKLKDKENSILMLYNNKEINVKSEVISTPLGPFSDFSEMDFLSQRRETNGNKFEKGVMRHSNESTVNVGTIKALPKKELSYLNGENVFTSRNSGSENLSISSSEGSYESLKKQTSRLTADHKIGPEPMRQIQKNKILATLLPDEILNDPINPKPRPCHIALMFPDVSGFTQLCKKYDKTGKGGPSRLTEVLNGYIGSMIEIVLSRNGDVCKFGGDAFLCVWKVTEEINIVETVHLAIESAVDIQKNCGEHKTDVGVKLGVKIAVAAGRALFSIIGTENRKHYVIFGPPVLEVREAEQLCNPGDVIVAPSAWKYVDNYMLYSYTYHSDRNHIKVHDFGPLWKSAKVRLKSIKLSSQSSGTRPFLKNALRLKVEDIRPFILPPVMKSIDLNQSLDYLTEMRQVAIVFFNVVVDFKVKPVEEVLKVTKKTFNIIARAVDKNDGATNKLTLFDKDMAVLTVFGLKGFKHELASQVALKCAYYCVEQLKKLDVISASAGVTTGMTYCGVIGHTLRKEYTVMGHPVNMAARLMCAYENIVSSDRETFLYSKLESNHFELLEHKSLKGIENGGPFYRFILQPKRSKLKLENDTLPLLGRGKEIKEFEIFLRNSTQKESSVNFMIIFGGARIGKSRLLATLINLVERQNLDLSENKMKRNRSSKKRILETWVISLMEDDSKISHSTSRLIFQQLLGHSELSTMEERQVKILSKLTDVKDIYLLASLNPVFNVNFELMPQYLALNEKQQKNAQMTLVIELYRKCLPENDKWIVVIDDAEFIDEESWILLKWISNESNKVLYLITIGQRKALTPAALDCLQHIRAVKITLTEIEKWFYAGLACQMLAVKAIPLELVNLLQKYKSSGNPGWLESFLVSLLQSGRIYTAQTPTSKIKTLGLVTVPDLMLSKNEVGEVEKFDSSYWIDCLQTFEKISDADTPYMRVCLLGPNFSVESNSETELTMDVMFIKTIDNLKPLEQLILKAGSVLGNNLKRSALKFLVSKDTVVEERQFAKAIKHLFQIKIITCAKGDLAPSNMLLPRKMIPLTSIRNEISCECTDVVIPPNCRDLPKYASCVYMQFRLPTFRDTLYNLLLDDQKKKFHISCIEYLTRNTFKCKSCRNEPFTNVLGYEGDYQSLACAKSSMHGVRSTKLNPKSTFPIPSLKKKLVDCTFVNSIYLMRRSSQNSESDLSPYSDADMGDCQCPKILCSVYSVLLEHAAGCGRKDIMLEIQLEYASVSLTTYNVSLTMQILEEALCLLNHMKEEKEHPEICCPYVYGKIYALMGATKLNMGRPSDSLELLTACLKCLNKSFPRSDAAVKFFTRKQILKTKLMTEFSEMYIGRVSDKKAIFTDLLSECLGLITLVHIYMHNWLRAKCASVWALNKALQSNRNFFGLCTAYTNMMDIAYMNNDLDTCALMEICAIDVCKRCSKKMIELYELEAICRLYRVIFQTRHVRAEIKEAADIGFQSIKIASRIRSNILRLELMPDLILALIQLNRLSEAVSLLQELEFMSLLESDKSSRVWYYAICLDFQLDTGFTVLPFETCEDFVKEEENMALVRDLNAKHRLYTSLWLWCVRNQEWDLSKPYGKALKGFLVTEGEKNPCSVLTLLKRLEGCLITLVHRMDLRSIYLINSTYSEIHSLMHKLEKDLKTVKLFQPRYQLLKAYYAQIRYRDNSFYRILNQAFLYAEKMKDKNTSQWIVHLKLVWGNAISPIQRDHWVEHCRYDLIDWHESDKVTKKQAVMYSLPLPKF